MEREQEAEWLEAQKILISLDLVAAAKQQLEFLAAVDRNRFLYDGPLLQRAIHRYKTCWLPLLARHTESGDIGESLTVPLDCEWIWHCHRLNPIQYRKDCEKLYGRVLDKKNVQSTVHEKAKQQTAEIWASFYPDEPFELDFRSPSTGGTSNKHIETLNTITYDLVSAVKRQSSFYHQVCRPIMHDKRFLDGAVARYKGFLHLIKRNRERSIICFCVPTYDIDLMWHAHQLQPISYQKDMLELLGKILEHDDTDSDRTKGKKLDTGFSDTTKQWEDAYGSRYWRAGAMYKGADLPLLDTSLRLCNYNQRNTLFPHMTKLFLPLQRTMAVEVLLEIVGIRNLPVNEKGNVFVSFSKKKPDMFLHGSCHLSIFSETGDKQVAGFECEPTGDLIVTLVTKSKPAKTIGSISISLDELMDPNAELSVDKWFELKRHSRQANSKPIYLRVAASFTVPVPSPQVFETLKLHSFSMNACRFPFPGMAQHMRSWAHFVDGYGNDIVSLQIRKSKETGGSMHPILKQNIFGMTKLSRNLHLLAEYVEDTWFFKDSNLSLTVQQNTNQEGYVLELKGVDQLKLFPGRKFEYQPKNAMQAKSENFMTVVEFSAENPYGKAMALFDLKSGLVKISEDCFVLPALVLSFILSSLLKKGGLITVVDSENLKAQDKSLSCTNEWGDKVNSFNAGAFGGCGAGCGGSGCGTIAKSGGCGSGCGGGCGGSGCGNVFVSNKSTGCGSGGCGGCGAAVNFGGAKQAPSEVTPVGA
ncbi:glycine-rich domain-containing protein 1-like [Phalaenopsis equestris]|uniref:glycine-rich domain-containing protein 1-like n=1 Tax=Phalaenopsis equestris TaxID=78828 RepID=UPI0009E2B55A|nr:glycine-rich domain-containing protein 1-like [Phalaenopsis equestris]